MCSLPFHAAGPYETEQGWKYLLDEYISSYTPALQLLIAARANVRARTKKPKVLFVSATKKLRFTAKERDIIRQLRILSPWCRSA